MMVDQYTKPSVAYSIQVDPILSMSQQPRPPPYTHTVATV